MGKKNYQQDTKVKIGEESEVIKRATRIASNDTVICAVNSGFYNTKIKIGDVLTVYPTRVQENLDAVENSLEIDGVLYEIGRGRKDLENSKDLSLVHRLCTIYAIASLVEDTSKIHLVVALPINLYMDHTFREKYKQSFVKNPDYDVICNGVPVKFSIDKITVYMEGASAVLSNPTFFTNNLVGLIDIGGYNINCAIFDNQQILMDTKCCLDYGMYKCEREIMDELSNTGNGYVKDYEIRYIFDSKEEDISSIVHSVLANHLSYLKQQLVSKGWNLKGGTLQLFATGGGSVTASSFIKEYFPGIVVSKTALYDNVLGLHIIGEVI